MPTYHEMICRFTTEQKKWLKREAKKRDESQAEIIRQAIEKGMRGGTTPAQK